MRRFLKWLVGLVGVLVLAAAALYAYAWHHSEQAMAKTYTVSDPPLTVKNDPETLARGAHLFATRGCADCHGADAAGKVVFDAGPVAKIVAPNLTHGGHLMHLGADQLAAAVRQGIKPDGHALVFMPSGDFHEMSDEDVAAIYAFLQSLPPSGNVPPPLEVRPLGRLLYLFGKFPLLPGENLDHSPRARTAPAMAATAEYGKYLAQGCTGCHGVNFAGQHVPGTPPSFKDSQNLTPANLGAWKEADFLHAIREGTRPDGSSLDKFMPWETYRNMNDVELKAIWAYLQTVPPVQSKKKGD